jgi:hypothetical protein
MSNNALRDLIDRFLRIAERYWRGWETECKYGDLVISPNTPDDGYQLTMDWARWTRRRQSVEKALRKIGHVLAHELAGAEVDPTPLVKFLSVMGSKRVAWDASPIWPDAEVCLRLAAIHAESDRLSGEAARAEKPQGLPEPRLYVDLAGMTVALNGKSYDVPSKLALRWLMVLVDHPGQWISAADLQSYDSELQGDPFRPDRVKHHLPAKVLALIDSDRRKGSRLRLP